MEAYFILILFLVMIFALGSGYPVAFALPGSAIVTIGIAALAGTLFYGDSSTFFAQGDPIQWLTAGVTNFRGIYWEVERDTLIAIPLFIFMGIMLQRSRIAEDLLVTMAQLFGSVPGGLGVSVVLVGGLLAATTGIVGATVVAMGMISLPAMMRNNYSKSLATGTICASGTLGQIIPPSIVLIILADQLSSASDQASTARKALYKHATGEFGLPSALDVTSTSAGNMFLGAFLPGIVLIGLYLVYILITSRLRPTIAPAIHNEQGFTRAFFVRVLFSLVPPLVLIFVVLGSIVMGVATVNQAGAIGAVGATIMASARLYDGKKGAYSPAILAIASLIALMVLLHFFDLNIRNLTVTHEYIGISLAVLASGLFLVSVFWSAWRTWRIEDTLKGVMTETAKTTSMVFIILLGAAMLTAAFRGFGGEEYVKHFLLSLPGGFWTQFIVVMLVIFVLGFFLDFIEIAVVVVPIVAPILLADPTANITAIWLGVMVGVNMQTSFLTPPFGFALFYLRGVADKAIRTIEIYKGVIPFIGLQLLGLAIVGAYPPLVNYLPNRIFLASDNAPPPKNPKLDQCVNTYLVDQLTENPAALLQNLQSVRQIDLTTLSEPLQKKLQKVFIAGLDIPQKLDKVLQIRTDKEKHQETYQILHTQVRKIERNMLILKQEIETLKQKADNEGSDASQALHSQIERLTATYQDLEQTIPPSWNRLHKAWQVLSKSEKRAIRDWHRIMDRYYQEIHDTLVLVESGDLLLHVSNEVETLSNTLTSLTTAQSVDAIQRLEKLLQAIPDTSSIKSALTKIRRNLAKGKQSIDDLSDVLQKSKLAINHEMQWRKTAALSSGIKALRDYEKSMRHTIGLRSQAHLPLDLVPRIASCKSYHEDISLFF